VDWVWDNRAGDDSQLPATLLRQVLINLVLNALQAAGVAGQVGVRCVGSVQGLQIEVENSGAVISAELMKHLFEPFTGHNEEGHGLGLWVTHQIVEQLHGQIDVVSRDGLTRFSVTLPKGESTWQPNVSA
jgi:signal transduction histidine kinase